MTTMEIWDVLTQRERLYFELNQAYWRYVEGCWVTKRTPVEREHTLPLSYEISQTNNPEVEVWLNRAVLDFIDDYQRGKEWDPEVEGVSAHGMLCLIRGAKHHLGCQHQDRQFERVAAAAEEDQP